MEKVEHWSRQKINQTYFINEFLAERDRLVKAEGIAPINQSDYIPSVCFSISCPIIEPIATRVQHEISHRKTKSFSLSLSGRERGGERSEVFVSHDPSAPSPSSLLITLKKVI